MLFKLMVAKGKMFWVHERVRQTTTLHQRSAPSPLTSEEVVVVFSQFDGSLIELPGTLPGLGTQPGPHALHALLVIGIEEDYDGVPLSVVQSVHSVWSNVQQGMFVLDGEKRRIKTV